MKPCLLRTLGIIAACAACFSSACGDDGAADVRAVYDEYNAAINRHDGDDFLRVIDPENVKHYDHFVRIAQRGTKEQIIRLGSIDRACVLILRHRLKPDELKELNGAAFVKLCIERAWFFGEDEGERFSLGRVKMNTPRATAELRINGEPTGDRLEFVLVDGHWLVNDEALDRAHEKAFAKAAAKLRMSEDRLIFELEADETGEDVDPRIFDAAPLVDTAPPEPVTITRDPKKPPKKR